MRPPPGTIHHRHHIRSPPTPGTGATKVSFAVHLLRRDFIRQLNDGMQARVRLDDTIP